MSVGDRNVVKDDLAKPVNITLELIRIAYQLFLSLPTKISSPWWIPYWPVQDLKPSYMAWCRLANHILVRYHWLFLDNQVELNTYWKKLFSPGMKRYSYHLYEWRVELRSKKGLPIISQRLICIIAKDNEDKQLAIYRWEHGVCLEGLQLYWEMEWWVLTKQKIA